jgi:hypothetical protein
VARRSRQVGARRVAKPDLGEISRSLVDAKDAWMRADERVCWAGTALLPPAAAPT